MAKKTVNYKAQDALIAKCKPAKFSFEHKNDDLTIEVEVDPFLTMQQKKTFVDIVYSMCFAGGDYLPSNFDTAVRVAALFTYTNLKIDFDNIYRIYTIADYCGLYDFLVRALGERGYEGGLRELELAGMEYVEWRKQESIATAAAAMSGAQKHAIDHLLESILAKLESALDNFMSENEGAKIEKVIDAIATMDKLQDEDRLVDNIIRHNFGKEGSVERGETSAAVLDEDGGGEEES